MSASPAPGRSGNVCDKCDRDTPAFCGEKFCPLNLAPNVQPATVEAIKALEARGADRYGVLLIGEFIGLLIGGGIFLGASGAANPYIALSIVLIAGCLHLTARKATHG